MVILVNTTQRLIVSSNREFEEDERCKGLGRGDQVGRNYDNFGDFHKHTRKKAYYNLGRGEQRGVVRRICLLQESQPIILQCRTPTTQRLLSHEERNVETRPTQRKRKFLPQIGWPTRHKTGFHQQQLSQQPLGFRMLNRQPLGFGIHTRKLNRQPLGFRKLNRRSPVLKAGKHLVTCNQRDMHQGEKFERHPGLSSHVKFSKLNRSLRPGFRPSELQTCLLYTSPSPRD